MVNKEILSVKYTRNILFLEARKVVEATKTSSLTNMQEKYKTAKIATTGGANKIKPKLKKLRPKIMKSNTKPREEKHNTLCILSQDKTQIKSTKPEE